MDDLQYDVFFRETFFGVQYHGNSCSIHITCKVNADCEGIGIIVQLLNSFFQIVLYGVQDILYTPGMKNPSG
jgi:hypothetical protein